MTSQDHTDDRCRKTVVEIQVMSAFMLAFSTPEHDVIYKTLHGKPPKDLTLNLDLLKGIANVGELLLLQYDNIYDSSFEQLCPQGHEATSYLRGRMVDLAREKGGEIQKILEKRERTRKILQWVFKVEVEIDHAQVGETLGLTYHGSGQWLQREFDDWLTASNEPMFWLIGSGLFPAGPRSLNH